MIQLPPHLSLDYRLQLESIVRRKKEQGEGNKKEGEHQQEEQDFLCEEQEQQHHYYRSLLASNFEVNGLVSRIILCRCNTIRLVVQQLERETAKDSYQYSLDRHFCSWRTTSCRLRLSFRTKTVPGPSCFCLGFGTSKQHVALGVTNCHDSNLEFGKNLNLALTFSESPGMIVC